MSDLYSNKFNLDKLYTKPEIAKWCIDKLDFSRYTGVVEPSAGDGSFHYQIPVKNKISYDVAPENPEIVQANWFDIQTDLTNWLVIGNPPYGIRNKLSRQFINHAETLGAETIAFILPNVFNKHTLQNHIRYNISQVYPLPENSFSYNGEDFSLPASFFIFEKNGLDTFRFDASKYTTCDDFDFSTASNYDFFIMGAAPSNVKIVVEPNNRGYYIKCKIDPEVVKRKFQLIDWRKYGNSSASGGVSWFTKPELIKIYIEANKA